MKICFLGTGAAEGIPAMFCSCPFCEGLRGGDKNKFRVRSQVLIDGVLSVDFPPEAYANSLRFGVNLSALKYLLVTHSHMDHFYAHDFILRGYKYAQLVEPDLRIVGDGEVYKVFEECTRREMREQVASHIDFSVAEPYEELELGNYRVLTLPAVHRTEERALLYYIERDYIERAGAGARVDDGRAGDGRGDGCKGDGRCGYLHLYDTSDLGDGAVEFLKSRGARAGAVALDCTFLTAPHADGLRHMCVEDCVRVRDKLIAAGVAGSYTQFVITHFSHHSCPTEEKLEFIEKNYGFKAAFDGLTVEV